MKRLSGVNLQVQDPAALAGFYTKHMGMSALRENQAWRVGYKGEDADLILLPGGRPYKHDRNQSYWKIGITLPDLDMAVAGLRRSGVEVSEPRQFLDIGYMAHLTDPEGFVIELLQWDFEGNRPEGVGDPIKPLGGRARVGQITLRTGNIDAEKALHRGMTCLSVQDVSAHGFDLHFLAFTDETPPDPDLTAVGNREWLWRRPYTTLEFQNVAGQRFAETPAFLGLEITG